VPLPHKILSAMSRFSADGETMSWSEVQPLLSKNVILSTDAEKGSFDERS
jgi:hypothetical protein